MKSHKITSLNYICFLISAFTLLVYFHPAPASAAVTYQAGDAPTAEIDHATVESIPGPSDRTTVGIKEQVSLSIKNWSDSDICNNGSGQTTVSDNYGTITWTPSNGGSCVPPTGPATTYSACESASDTNETVTMNADDSNTLGNDAAINVQLAFAVKVPKTHELPCRIHSHPGYPPLGPPNDMIGAMTYFIPQHGPLTVSFKNVTFRENYPDAVQIWPDGSPLSRAGDTPGYSVGVRFGAPNYWNPMVDSRGTGKYAKAKLLKPGDVAPNYTAAEMVFSVPLEFQANGSFHEFTDPPAFYKFFANLKAKASFDTTYGTEQGPWQ